MTIKEQLLQEIESTPDNILTEVLDFLRYIKTKETQTQPQSETPKSAIYTSVNSTGRLLLEHLKTISNWEGNDLEDCLQLVIATRSKAKFDYDNPFE